MRWIKTTQSSISIVTEKHHFFFMYLQYLLKNINFRVQVRKYLSLPKRSVTWPNAVQSCQLLCLCQSRSHVVRNIICHASWCTCINHMLGHVSYPKFPTRSITVYVNHTVPMHLTSKHVHHATCTSTEHIY